MLRKVLVMREDDVDGLCGGIKSGSVARWSKIREKVQV